MKLIDRQHDAYRDAPLSGDHDQDARNVVNAILQTIIDHADSPRTVDYLIGVLREPA